MVMRSCHLSASARRARLRASAAWVTWGATRGAERCRSPSAPLLSQRVCSSGVTSRLRVLCGGGGIRKTGDLDRLESRKHGEGTLQPNFPGRRAPSYLELLLSLDTRFGPGCGQGPNARGVTGRARGRGWGTRQGFAEKPWGKARAPPPWIGLGRGAG